MCRKQIGIFKQEINGTALVTALLNKEKTEEIAKKLCASKHKIK